MTSQRPTMASQTQTRTSQKQTMTSEQQTTTSQPVGETGGQGAADGSVQEEVATTNEAARESSALEVSTKNALDSGSRGKI